MCLILTEGFRTDSERMAGVERLAVMLPDSAFLDHAADEPLVMPGNDQVPSFGHGQCSEFGAVFFRRMW